MRTTSLDREGGDRGSRPRRGPARFTYGYKTLADLLGVRVKTLQNAASLGKFNPRSLESVVDYIAARRARKKARRA